MLRSIRKSAVAMATATLCLASAAQAANHTVLIVDGGYFPELIHVQEGDNVYFTNNTDVPHTVVSSTGAWTTGELGLEGRFQLKIRGIADLAFSGLDANGEVVLNLDGGPMAGTLTYDAPPVDDFEDEENDG